jgi:hypothetical protein
MPPRNLYIARTLELVYRMRALADEAEAEAADEGCAVLYGVLRDYSYSIEARAERERRLHDSVAAQKETESCASSG